jgi:hypothetical protein
MSKWLSFFRLFLKRGWSLKEAWHMSDWQLGRYSGIQSERKKILKIIDGLPRMAHDQLINGEHLKALIEGGKK